MGLVYLDKQVLKSKTSESLEPGSELSDGNQKHRKLFAQNYDVFSRNGTAAIPEEPEEENPKALEALSVAPLPEQETKIFQNDGEVNDAISENSKRKKKKLKKKKWRRKKKKKKKMKKKGKNIMRPTKHPKCRKKISRSTFRSVLKRKNVKAASSQGANQRKKKESSTTRIKRRWPTKKASLKCRKKKLKKYVETQVEIVSSPRNDED